MKRITFIKASVPVVAIGTICTLTSYMLEPELVNNWWFSSCSTLGTIIAGIGTTTLANHLDEDSTLFGNFVISLIFWVLITRIIYAVEKDISFLVGSMMLNLAIVVFNYKRCGKKANSC